MGNMTGMQAPGFPPPSPCISVYTGLARGGGGGQGWTLTGTVKAKSTDFSCCHRKISMTLRVFILLWSMVMKCMFHPQKPHGDGEEQGGREGV